MTLDSKPWPPAYRINPRMAALPPDLVAESKGAPAAHAGDSMGRAIGAVDLLAYHGSLSLMFVGTTKNGPGEVNVPIACGGIAVSPGDLVIGDADSVTTIPAAEAAALLPRVRVHAAREAETRAENASGTTDPERFNAPLRAKGCPV